jgi:hypothetical protein
MGLLLLAVAVAVAVAAATADLEPWMRTVNDVLGTISLGELRADLRPADFARRNRTEVVRGQVNHLRAKVMLALLHTVATNVWVCPPEETSREAIDTVVDELRKRTFTAAWIPDKVAGTSCALAARSQGIVYVEIPATTIR